VTTAAGTRPRGMRPTHVTAGTLPAQKLSRWSRGFIREPRLRVGGVSPFHSKEAAGFGSASGVRPGSQTLTETRI
jgi:hypothetical protein